LALGLGAWGFGYRPMPPTPQPPTPNPQSPIPNNFFQIYFKKTINNINFKIIINKNNLIFKIII